MSASGFVGSEGMGVGRRGRHVFVEHGEMNECLVKAACSCLPGDNTRHPGPECTGLTHAFQLTTVM